MSQPSRLVVVPLLYTVSECRQPGCEKRMDDRDQEDDRRDKIERFEVHTSRKRAPERGGLGVGRKGSRKHCRGGVDHWPSL